MINISSNIYEKQQICKYLITYQHLCDESALESTDRIVEYINEIAVEGIKYPLYIATENLELLQASKNDSIKSNYARILAPLDNILWDRKLIAELFDFEYKWEVYIPIAKRKYGYYVLPVLCDNKFIGRIEMETDKKSKTLIVKNFWSEDEIYDSIYRNNIISGIDKFKEYNLCDNVEICCSI